MLNKEIRKINISCLFFVFSTIQLIHKLLTISRMATANSDLPEKYEKWLRIAILIDFAGRHLCYELLHKKEQLPTDGAKLYKELKDLKSKICRFKDQEEILCPSSEIIDESKFDLTLLLNVIDKKFPNKYVSFVTDLRRLRNIESHRGDKSLSNEEFDKKWNETIQILQNHGFNIKLVGDLKTCNLSPQFKDIAMKILSQGIVEIVIYSVCRRILYM